jgi:hypothetical protein
MSCGIDTGSVGARSYNHPCETLEGLEPAPVHERRATEMRQLFGYRCSLTERNNSERAIFTTGLGWMAFRGLRRDRRAVRKGERWIRAQEHLRAPSMTR